MAQNKNTTKKPEGLCKKIQNAVSPFRAQTFRMSNQPHGSISITDNKKPPSPRTGPVRFLHQPSHSKMIPVEVEPGRDFAEREVVIIKSRKFSKLSPKKESSSQPESGDDDRFSDYITKVKDRMMKTASNASGGGGGPGGGGGGGGGEISTVKDSFNDKVTNYITRTKIKVRKTTTVGADKSFSFLK